jgi:hypothetical protein
MQLAILVMLIATAVMNIRIWRAQNSINASLIERVSILEQAQHQSDSKNNGARAL